ncbi:MAG TPA: response regulator transcription factor [Balneolaceae bacterium]|nr:response regulator transcription factor [Balneolaceae bacterium]
MRVLVIEDESVIQTLIKSILQKNDHTAISAGTATKGQKLAEEEELDAIILDLGLPDGDGFELCELLRSKQITIPILILSGKDSADVKVQCLNAGADDYLTKPFNANELIARINAITRRTVSSAPAPTANGIITGGELTINKIKRTCTIRDADIPLTNNELDLLAYLMEKKGSVVSQYKIQEDLWDIDYYTPSNFINVYISYIRKKLKKHTDHKYIKTIRNKGFVFNTPTDSN